MEYKGYEILVRTGFVVLGDDPMGEPVEGYIADIRLPDAIQDDPEGRTIYDFPFDHMESTFQGLTQNEVVEEAKAFIDAHAKGEA